MKCFVKLCRNHDHQGHFKGKVCKPCWQLAKDIERESISDRKYQFDSGCIIYIINNWKKILKQAEGE